MIETYRMLGKQHEDELLREALRLQAGTAARGFGRRPRVLRLEALRRGCASLLMRLRSSMIRSASTAE